MNIYDLRTEDMVNPVGIDCKKVRFSWKIRSTAYSVMQKAFNITVSKDSLFKDIIWNSGWIFSENSLNIPYNGREFEPSRRYYWRVSARDNKDRECVSGTAYFETGLMGKDKSVWSGAKWIGSPDNTINTDSLKTYSFSGSFRADKDNSAGFVIAARNKDNYILIDINTGRREVRAFEYCDHLHEGGNAEVKNLGRQEIYIIPENALEKGADGWNDAEITADGDMLTLLINGCEIIREKGFIPDDPPNMPRKQCMLSLGFKQENSRAVYKNIKIKNTHTGEVYQYAESRNLENTIISALGKAVNGELIAENTFNLINPVPSVNVRKIFDVTKKVKSARLYASAMGFYEAYINGTKVNSDYYAPGFTDYRKRIYYQTYDVTEYVKEGTNSIGAVAAKGYYTGYVGYTPCPMVYGKKNKFICKLLLEYENGGKEIIVSDESWDFTDMGPVVNADYLQGEDYDARLEFDWNDENDTRWRKCSAADFPLYAEATNGDIGKEPFELTAQNYTGAKIERILTPKLVCENPAGCFVYDFGQNMVGILRVRLKAERGKSFKIRYGEMCYKDGRLYTANLRSAANIDTYTAKGLADTEVFEASFVSHGFRYAEISGNGCRITQEDIENITPEGLVITNTTERTGFFECSDEYINKLQSNIEWGQRGNSLLVFTDCPQRNERMGWTGDAQVFAPTAAYNMYIKEFMNKWLADLRDAQLLYNRKGAVPDTAPLGGDNRPTGGCGGWGDAAVFVPWDIYLAYGDIKVLEDNYDMMKKWVDYQSLDERQNRGVRIVDNKEMPEQSDLSSEPFIQIQQSRGDHLTFDESTPFILSATAYSARSAYLLAETAKLLGYDDDYKKYYARFENIKKAFCEAWVEEDGTISYWGEMSKSNSDKNGNIINHTYYSEKSASARPSQTAYALAIDFDLIPEEKRGNAAKAFCRAIDDFGGKLSVGFLGISHIASALTKSGFAGRAFALLEQKENPSWLYSVVNGATTIWERWDSYVAESGKFGNALMNSFNHYSYGAVGEWMFGCILGINTSNKAGETGYKRIILKPYFGGSLCSAGGYYESAHGRIVSEWRTENGKFIYKCAVPANTRAVICLPSVKADMSSVVQGEEIIFRGIIESRAVFETGSGEFLFDVNI